MSEITAENNQQWSEVLTPKNKLLDLRLKEVWRYRDLLVLFVKRDMAAQYKQTVLGPVWYIIQPILTTLLSLILFTSIANISTGTVPPLLFYIASYSIWNYFSFCLSGTSTTFTSNAAIFGKVYFPRLVLPLSIVLSNIVKFGIQFGLLLAFLIFYWSTGRFPFSFGWHTFLIPVILIIMAGLGLGLGIIISSLTTKYRDFTVLVNFGVQLMMYVTPVVYPLAFLAVKKPRLFAIIKWNPLSPLLEQFRYAIFGTGTLNIAMLAYSFGFTLISLFVGVIIFNRVERSFMDTV